MITIGVDAHKRVHEAMALDEAGREIGRWRGPNSIHGWSDFRAWAYELGDDRQIGVEGAWGYGRGLAQSLVCSEEVVFDVNSRWTAAARQRSRPRGKSDRLDARAVALILRQEESLPEVQVEDETAVLDLLATEREGALGEATRLRNQIHALLMQIDPEYKEKLPSLTSRAGVSALLVYETDSRSPVQQERAAAVRRLAQRLELAAGQAKELKTSIGERARERYGPLTQLCGVNLLTAGTLAGLLGPGRRFRSDAQLAAYAGVAPLEASSAEVVRHRLNRGGNRRLNAVVYRIALTQLHHSEQARAYVDRRVSEGKTKREARRALQRYIIRAIWKLWHQCDPKEGPRSMWLCLTAIAT